MHETTGVFAIFFFVLFAAPSDAHTPWVAASAQLQIECCKYPLQANSTGSQPLFAAVIDEANICNL